jgi:hypothetical protein
MFAKKHSPSPMPDLEITGVTWNTNDLYWSATNPAIHYVLAVKNNGATVTLPPTQYRSRFLVNTTWTTLGVDNLLPITVNTGDTFYVFGSTAGSDGLPNLRAEIGDYNLCFDADATNALAESNETNNGFCANVHIIL